MTNFTRHDASTRFDADDFFPGERLDPDHLGSKRKVRAWGGGVVLLLLGGAWTLFGDPAALTGWWSALTASPLAVTDSQLTGNVPPPPPIIAEPAVKPAAVDAAAAPLPPPASIETATLPPQAVVLALPPAQTIAPEPAVKAVPEPPAPVAPTAGPHQKRAKAVGLHPDLSQVLLERLSVADYRNAGVAIRTALAETPDTAVLVWPRQRTPEQALFKVRFVPGATAGCRRYVVTVTKDGWLTTALPMENCDVKVDGTKVVRSKAG